VNIPIHGKSKDRKSTIVIAYAQIDDEDYDKVKQYRWYLTVCGYVATSKIRMHRLILGLPPSIPKVDHINHNPLDNRKTNLRLCDESQNGGNRLKNRIVKGAKPTSKYKGVTFDKYHEKWAAAIKITQQKIHLGYFKIELDAAIAYNNAAKQYFNEFALLNDVNVNDNLSKVFFDY